MSVRNERIADLEFVDQSAAGNPTVPGVVRWTGTDVVIYINGEVKSLITGSGMSEEQHKVLRQLIHFLESGPGDGFGSTPYRETTWSGVKQTAEVWYTDSGKTNKVVELVWTYSGVKITGETTRVYKSDGTSPGAEAVVTVTYSGIMEINRSRAITVY